MPEPTTLEECPTPKDAQQLHCTPELAPFLAPGSQIFAWRGMRVIRSVEDGKLHVSFSYARRLPDWNDIKRVRYEFTPDRLYMAIILPPSSQYVNLHNFTHHLWEISPEEGGGLIVG